MTASETAPADSRLARRSEQRNSWRWAGALFWAIALGGGGYAGYHFRADWQPWAWERWGELKQALVRDPQRYLPPAVTPTTVAVAELPAETTAVLPRRFNGTIKSQRTSEVGFNRVGVIAQVLVRTGDRVAQGQILAELDLRLLEANQQALEAQFRAATARMQELEAGPREQTIAAARATVAAKLAEKELAEVSLQRNQRLVNTGAVSRQDLDNATTEVAAKTEAWKAADQALAELLAGTRSEQLQAQQAVLDELQASLEQVQVQLAEGVLTAPFDAIVSQRHLDEGAVVSPGVAVLRLIENAPPEAWIGLPPDLAFQFEPQEEVTVIVDGDPLPAHYRTTRPELDRTTRTQSAIFVLKQFDGQRSDFGKLCQIELNIDSRDQGFWVPMSALTQGDHGLWSVLVVADCAASHPTVQKRDVEVLHVNSQQAFVQGTITAGEMIIVEGVQRLTAGQIVAPVIRAATTFSPSR